MTYRNKEHYPDPTVGTVMCKIASENKEKGIQKYVYICSPYKGDIHHNTLMARRFCRFAVQQNCIPMCPHIYFTQFLNERIQTERNKGMRWGILWLKRCSEIWVFGSVISEGMDKEIQIARKRKMPIRYFTEECEEIAYRA